MDHDDSRPFGVARVAAHGDGNSKLGGSILVVPVLDVAHGLVVAARGGQRQAYAPLSAPGSNEADPLAWAEVLRSLVGHNTLYLADLDAIESPGSPPSPAVTRLVDHWLARGRTVWLDAGSTDAIPPFDLDTETGHPVIVAGSETLVGANALARLVAAHGAHQVIFSLDLRDGTPITPPQASWTDRHDPLAVLEQAIDQGVERVLLLDLAAVGRGGGVDGRRLDLVQRLRQRHPSVEAIIGGGLAGWDDLAVWAEAGVNAVLVGSALHRQALNRDKPSSQESRSDEPDCVIEEPTT